MLPENLGVLCPPGTRAFRELFLRAHIQIRALTACHAHAKSAFSNVEQMPRVGMSARHAVGHAHAPGLLVMRHDREA